MRIFFLIALLCVLFVTGSLQSCGNKTADSTNESKTGKSNPASSQAEGQVVVEADYDVEIKNWREQRISNLKLPRSWTSLIGLAWLKDGENTFGSALSNAVVLNDSAPEAVGIWTVTDEGVNFRVSDGVKVLLDDDSKFHEGPASASIEGPAVIFHLGSLYWTIIKRSELYGVRVWDTLHPLRNALTEIPHYKTSTEWRLEASIHPALEGETIIMDNAVGQSIEYPVAAHVISSKDGTDINLIALAGGENSYFLIFSDLTTDIETYPGGRYMYIPKGDSLGNTVLDFNKSYNPPCVFTAFATCLLPPKSNFIDLEVLAGEKDYGVHAE